MDGLVCQVGVLREKNAALPVLNEQNAWFCSFVAPGVARAITRIIQGSVDGPSVFRARLAVWFTSAVSRSGPATPAADLSLMLDA